MPFRRHVQRDAGADVLLQFVQRGLAIRIDRFPRCACRSASAGSPRRHAFELPDGQLAARGLLRQVVAQLSIFDRQQRAAMARRDFAFFDPFEQRLFERKQADGIGDGGAVLPRSGSHFVLREVKFFHQAVECARLLDGIQILALNVFDERELERLLVAYFSQDNRHAQKLRALRSAPSALSRDELVSRADLSHNERLDDSARANGLRQFLECRFRKSRSRLIRARIDQVDVDLQRPAGGNLRWCDCRCGFLWMQLAGVA